MRHRILSQSGKSYCIGESVHGVYGTRNTEIHGTGQRAWSGSPVGDLHRPAVERMRQTAGEPGGHQGMRGRRILGILHQLQTVRQ